MQARALAFKRLSAPSDLGLSGFSIFDGVSRSDLERLEGLSQVRSYRKGQMVFLPGDPGDRFFLVLSGRVKLSRLSDGGKELILDLSEPGTMFGEAAVVEESERDSLAEAVEPTRLRVVPAAPFRALVARDPRAASVLMKLLARQKRNLERRLLEVVHKNAPERLAGLLLDLAKRYGVPDARGTMIRVKLSQTTLGNWLGVSREIVNHTFSRLKARGIIEVVEGRIIIRKIDDLSTAAAAA